MLTVETQMKRLMEAVSQLAEAVARLNEFKDQSTGAVEKAHAQLSERAMNTETHIQATPW